jgi:ribosome-associated protein
MIEIRKDLFIPEEELSFTFSRSGGPGGQNVNKVSSRVTLWFDVENSKSLSDEQKRKIVHELPTRINKQGILHVVSQKHRSQWENREDAVERFVELLRAALRRRVPRKKTKAPGWVKEKRLQQKGHRSRVKAQRSKPVKLDE